MSCGLDIKDLLSGAPAALVQRYGLSGMVLSNGSRFYVDCAHPEYSIPETSNPLDALLAQKAGDFIVNECRKRAEEFLRNKKSPVPVRLRHPTMKISIDRTNSDWKGASYAGHENYSVSPKIFRELTDIDDHLGPIDLAKRLMTFLAARQIITGAGKVGYDGGKPVDYQISARSDFVETEIGPHTSEDRPIINTRDHPYADERILRRLHIICGDSNMSQLSLYLKFGITALFLMMLESGFLEKEETIFNTPLLDPVLSFRNISRDIALGHKVFFANRAKKTALELMFEASSLMKRFADESNLPFVWKEVVQKLEKTLTGLDGNRHESEFSRDLDWVVKERLVDCACEENKIGRLDPACFMINVHYQDIDPEESFFYELERKGEIARLVSDSEIQSRVANPPEDTRASLRGRLVSERLSELAHIGWDYVLFKDGSYFKMDDPRLTYSEYFC